MGSLSCSLSGPRERELEPSVKATRMSAACPLIVGQAQSRLMAEHWTRCDCGCACIRKSAVTGNGCFEKRKRGGGNWSRAGKNCSECSKEATRPVESNQMSCLCCGFSVSFIFLFSKSCLFFKLDPCYMFIICILSLSIMNFWWSQYSRFNLINKECCKKLLHDDQVNFQNFIWLNVESLNQSFGGLAALFFGLKGRQPIENRQNKLIKDTGPLY